MWPLSNEIHVARCLKRQTKQLEGPHKLICTSFVGSAVRTPEFYLHEEDLSLS